MKDNITKRQISTTKKSNKGLKKITVKGNASVEKKRSSTGKIKKNSKAVEIQPIYSKVAGIDIGSTLIHITVTNEKNEYEVREFGTLTPDLLAIASWLSSLNIQSAAMEATGVYWIPLYEILRDKGLNPVLVDPKSAKNVPGRKTDVLDCQWIHKLFSCGLLRPAFRPAKEAFRAYMRHRNNLIPFLMFSLIFRHLHSEGFVFFLLFRFFH